MAADATQEFLQNLPEVKPGESFWFDCHPKVRCFNACCSDLTMPLTPYDVLRLCTGLGMGSEEFFEEFASVGCYEDTGFPLLHLRMDDSPARLCPFVTDAGCGVYAHRSSACRTYPLGRATRPAEQGGSHSSDTADDMRPAAPCPGSGQSLPPVDIPLLEQYFLVREEHCKGFAESREWTTATWLADQGLEPYNRMNDRYMRLISRYKPLANGAILSGKHATMALLCLYQQDRFLEFIQSMSLFQRVSLTGEYAGDPEGHQKAILANPEERLKFAYDWVELVLLGSTPNLEPGVR